MGKLNYNSIKEIIQIIWQLLSTDNELISKEVEEILNSSDKKQFLEEVRNMRRNKINKKTIVLNSGKEITIGY